ncbi:MAG TPA: 16S rRNA (cytosine(1402)-N(4))-methyltransferase [Acholeplasmataceae bacterium]|nr:MAG: 16S rRNA (cytosine(1402)-N(4))-methyltransferase [Tenericutes bacterium GWA2_38_26]OHE30858.1 MAG: 16S rRNA (cytosine(1402)-N(4))-methyltransferase [Tenericutes bacterium GWC2_39_45]OHE32029.1 MAG: 16S rRNA (cytosine(1402)-N(4))-methyltransferase [Tenericutes bacterium GWD2_38_27]OHE39867.1 MAG: 16S rRNA (cytosine(1402)-N(4))-methyltransferase [Tenericutes bacterium GWE2_38_8]HBY64867.1 16S rRNA (cytosine(1402)-N(4))-methyltransferase [Acholeplasmataceae bacterium]
MKHETVLKEEAIQYLNIKENGIYVDGTLGGAGHSKLILEHLKDGFLYAFDQDDFAISFAKDVLKGFKNYKIIKSNFRFLKEKLKEEGIEKIDGLLLDLGLSSFQIDDETRGFTYLKDTSLDMRMDQDQSVTAETILNTYSMEELARIFFVYGEERNSFKIARRIVEKRPLKTTMELVKICDSVNYNEKGHSSKRVFQALRIAVNEELTVLEEVLADAVDLLNPDGRLVVITFHSLEDRIVKHFFKDESTSNLPKNLPVIELPDTKMELITRKPVYPTDEEYERNPRSKSAKLRAARKK